MARIAGLTHTEGGRCRTVKMPTELSFKPLKEALESPLFFQWDFAKLNNGPNLHVLWKALYSFEKKVITDHTFELVN